VTAASGLRPCV